MSLLSIRPGKTETYAHYLCGLGLGVIIGSFTNWDFHLTPVVFGIVLIIIAMRIDHSVSKEARAKQQTPEELIEEAKKEVGSGKK